MLQPATFRKNLHLFVGYRTHCGRGTRSLLVLTLAFVSLLKKYGIEIPTSIKHAEEIDHRNKNTFWQDAIKLEMSNVGVAFKILERGESPPPGYTKSSGHIVFDVRMGFQRKARWVKDGHRTPDPDTSSYAGVGSIESIRILLTRVALHGFPVMLADVRNAYLQAPT